MKKSTFGKLLATSIVFSNSVYAHPEHTITLGNQKISMKGDVEFNTNLRNDQSDDNSEINQDGRIRLQLNSIRATNDNQFIRVFAQPLINTNGTVGVNDAFISFGKKSDWTLKVGRFKSYNLSPAGQDTYIENVSGFSVYRANDGRGRGDNGQLSFSKQLGAFYFEVSSLMAQPTEGSKKNAAFIRPVIEYKITDSLRIAGGIEANMTKTDQDPSHDFVGYGTTVKYAANHLKLNLSYAHRNFNSKDEKDNSIVATLLYHGFGLANIYACDNILGKTAKLNTTYASYKFSNVMDVKDLALFLGTFYSKETTNNQKDMGTRLRIKYHF